MAFRVSYKTCVLLDFSHFSFVFRLFVCRAPVFSVLCFKMSLTGLFFATSSLCTKFCLFVTLALFCLSSYPSPPVLCFKMSLSLNCFSPHQASVLLALFCLLSYPSPSVFSVLCFRTIESVTGLFFAVSSLSLNFVSSYYSPHFHPFFVYVHPALCHL